MDAKKQSTMDEMLKIVEQDFDTFSDTISSEPGILSTKDENERTLLHWLSLGGKEQKVKLLLTKPVVIVDAEDDVGATPLILATLKGNLNIVKMLSDKGAELNRQNREGHSSLQYACSKGWKDIVAYLLSKNVDVNIRDKRGDTPLHRLASLGYTEIMTNLLQHSPKPNLDLQNSEGCTPLHIACQDEQTSCALLLVANKAIIDIVNKDEKTAMDYCKPSLKRSIIEKSKEV